MLFLGKIITIVVEADELKRPKIMKVKILPKAMRRTTQIDILRANNVLKKEGVLTIINMSVICILSNLVLKITCIFTD